MRRLCAVLGFAAVTAMSVSACGGRQVNVGTTPTTAASTLRFTNNATFPVNVFVVEGTTETFVRQVAANTTESLPVRGVAMGAQVRYRAVSVDGRQVYDSPMVVVSSTYTWKVP